MPPAPDPGPNYVRTLVANWREFARQNTKTKLALAFLGALALLAYGQFEGWFDLRDLAGRARAFAPAAADLRVRPLRIAVFHPKLNGNRAACLDAQAQREGFDDAFETFDGGVNRSARHFVEYDFYEPDKERFAADTLARMQELYTKHDVRVFIITMSSAVQRIRSDFKAWRDHIAVPGERPLLLCTVASTPGLADIESGILRYYVRTEEEAIGLARYARWARDVESIAVLFVTKEVGKRNDIYGESNRAVFTEEFTTIGGRIAAELEIDPDGHTADRQVRAALASLPPARRGVYVAGYGTMFREALDALVQQRFNGVVFCTSTISEDDWRPAGSDQLDLVTIEPTRRKSARPASGFERKVVRFMARQTLLRALECAKDSRTTADFLRYWQKNSEGGVADELEVEYIANGDTLIKVRPLRFSR